jgi:L-amino acid N-acyltransferase YncA
MSLQIRPATTADQSAIWAILKPVFRAGDTYAIDPDIPRDTAISYWCGSERHVYVAEENGEILGTYYIVRNQKGGGSHVCNSGYVTAKAARGKGVARAMLTHSLDTAPQLGFRAMQYNFVVSTNERAIKTWERAGFDIIGRLPGAFQHPQQGYVDALIMYKALPPAP